LDDSVQPSNIFFNLLISSDLDDDVDPVDGVVFELGVVVVFATTDLPFASCLFGFSDELFSFLR